MRGTLLDPLIPLLDAAGIPLREEKARLLLRFTELIIAWNARMDLTAVPESEFAIRHFADSLLPLAEPGLFPDGASLVDVGAGAGFPGMPLAIVREDLSVTLLESQRKKCLFLREAVIQLGLSDTRVLCARAEDAARGLEREVFDLATVRAVAPLRVLAEYLLPLLRRGGRMLCWKGPSLLEELPDAANALQVLGGRAVHRFTLPIPGRVHYIQVIEKTGPTPPEYPRRPGIPAARPL